MLVWMPLNGSLFVRFFYICLACILVHAKDSVVILALCLLYLYLSFAQLFTQARGLRCHVFELVVFVKRLFPLLLVHLDVALLQIGLHILRIQRYRSITVCKRIVVLT